MSKILTEIPRKELIDRMGIPAGIVHAMVFSSITKIADKDQYERE